MKKTSIVITVLMMFALVVVSGCSVDQMENKRDNYLDLKTSIIQESLEEGNYRCCLEEPCSTCVELDPWHGEDEKCECLADVMNGKAPCGECVGGILAGRGNKYIAEYFAKAIAEEVGHEDIIKDIISEKYDITTEEQI